MDLAVRESISALARPAALAIEPYVWEAANHEIAARYGLYPSQVIRFDTNTSPIPPPCLPAILDQARVEPAVNEYFDGSYAALAAALTAYTGVSPEHFVIGAGADEILDVVAKTFLDPGDVVVIPTPTYALYRIVAQTMDATIRALPIREDLSFDPDALALAARDAKAIFLCNPNNPTGRALSVETVTELVRRVSCLVVVDEAYAEFSGQSVLELATREPRLIVVRTLSKAFSLAGGRIGYGVSTPETIELTNRLRPPNSISYISAILGEAAVRDQQSMRVLVATLLAEGQWLADALREMGREVIPSVTNFVLVRWPSPEAAAHSHEVCLSQGMVLRSYPEGHPLASYLRMTVRTREQNLQLLEALHQAGGLPTYDGLPTAPGAPPYSALRPVRDAHMPVILAAVHHDPDGRLHDQLTRMLPLLSHQFAGLVVQASHVTHDLSLKLLLTAGALVEQEAPDGHIGYTRLGRTRRAAVRLALRMGAELILSIDLDRALHRAEYYPQELAATVTRLAEHDCTVIGRTPRAFDSHPRIQRDTEALINHVFSLVGRHTWDVTAATRGLTRHAAEAILAGCLDEGISTDVSWPLFLRKDGGFSIGYIETEGMEFETADRYGEEIAAVGGHTEWIARLDADPRRWAHRVELACLEIEAMLPYAERNST